jgi:tetratricopeptide (TPR) repeat protein
VLLSRLEKFFLNIEMPDKAIETYNNAINAHEDAILPKLLLGKLFYSLEMVDRAIRIFEEIDSEFEYAPVLFYFMGKIQMRKGQDSEAAETFKEVLRTSGILDAEYKCSNCGKEYSEYLAPV